MEGVATAEDDDVIASEVTPGLLWRYTYAAQQLQRDVTSDCVTFR